MMNSDIAIKASNVSKTFRLPHEKQSSIKGTLIAMSKGHKRTYEKQQALKDVSFEVKNGDFFAIVGRNGSGKSTLLKLLAGIYSPSEGEIQVNGKLTPFIELGVGFSPELSGRENVFLNGALLGFNRAEMAAMYDDIVKFAELGRFMDQKLKNYSSGMQVRLAFSIAIRAQSDILLLDEVLAVGDAAFQQKCFNYFEELKEQKKTVVFVSHDMHAVKRFCNKAIYIKDSKLIYAGTPAEIGDMYLEENIESIHKAEGRRDDSHQLYSLTAKIKEQTSDSLALNFSYKSKEHEEVYLGISVIREGISVAEINTLPDVTLKGSGEISYQLDTSLFNGGVYYVTTAVFRRHNRELLSTGKNQCEFIIKDDQPEPTTGGALKLANTWEILRKK